MEKGLLWALLNKTEIIQKPRLKSAYENACIISSSGRKGVMPVGSFIKQDFRRAGRESADQGSLVLLPLLPYLLLILKPSRNKKLLSTHYQRRFFLPIDALLHVSLRCGIQNVQKLKNMLNH